jgi:hypothetical protein
MTFPLLYRIEDPRLGAGLVRLGATAVPSSRPRVRIRLRKLIEVAERERWLCPVAACRVLPAVMEAPSCWRIGARTIASGALERLVGANEVAVIFATIGVAWSDAVSARFRQGGSLDGFLLDELGTAVLERWSRRIEALVRMSARSRGQRAGSPVEPGHPGLPLAVQSVLAELVESHSVGIEITSGGMLTPVKSISMLIGIGNGLRRWSRAETCRECPSSTSCRGQGRRSGNDA